MATRSDAIQTAQETASLGVSTVVESIATGIIEIDAATPVVALCVAVLKAKGIVEGASRNKEELDVRMMMLVREVVPLLLGESLGRNRLDPILRTWAHRAVTS